MIIDKGFTNARINVIILPYITDENNIIKAKFKGELTHELFKGKDRHHHRRRICCTF